jgi:hypothetical protein
MGGIQKSAEIPAPFCLVFIFVNRFFSFVIIKLQNLLMAKRMIPVEIVIEANSEIAKYNAANYSSDSGIAYKAYAKGDYLYIDRNEYGRDTKAFRLLFRGKIEIFKWSSERYTDDTFGMPGEQFLDGTVIGAMKAADALYPPPGKKNDLDMLQQLMKLFGSDH